MVEYVAQALKQISKEAIIMIYAPALDPHQQKIIGLADSVFYIYSMSGQFRQEAMERMPEA